MVRVATKDELESHGETYKKLFLKLQSPTCEITDSNENPFETSSICIFARIRPLLKNESTKYSAIVGSKSNISVHRPIMSVRGIPTFDSHHFKLHSVFDQTTSDDKVYEKSCKPLLELVLKGGTSIIFAYGQTGSGKTHSIIGCLQKICCDIFSSAAAPSNLKYSLSLIEILGNKITDLFDDDTKVTIKEDKFGRAQFVGLTNHEIGNASDFLALLEVASRKRSTEKTAKNDTSSRSHMLVRLEVTNTTLEGSSKGILYVVDLAGSENTNDSSSHSKERLEETRLINTSLMTLKDCMRGRSLVQSARGFIHIPYRASKLTLALRECFELAVRCPVKVSIIACINPLEIDSSHSLNTLRYASGIYVCPSQVVLQPKENDPFFWSRQKSLDWITKETKGAVSLDFMLPSGNGATLSEIPEHEFMERAMKSGKMGEKQAKLFYLKLWRMIVDARTKNRKEIIRQRNKLAMNVYSDENQLPEDA